MTSLLAGLVVGLHLAFIMFAALVFRSVIARLLAGIVAGVLAQRIDDEERLMAQEFGDAWREYARRSWRLVPWIY